MYPDPESRADQFDDALERRLTGQQIPVDDPELQELLQLAARLERDLPNDIPDPAFRDNLRQQLLSGQASISQEPVDLASERWYRRLAASPWRLSAAAAAFLVVILVAVVMGVGPMSDDDDDTEEIVSFEALDDDPSTLDDGNPQGDVMFEVREDSPESQQWLAASYPPLDSQHVVLPPMLTGFTSLFDYDIPQIELNGASEMVADADMPETATVYYLSAPSDPQTMLTTLRATFAIDAELVPGDGEGEPHRLVDEDDEPVMLWDPYAAFFHFRGDLLDDPVDDLADDGADPIEVASSFLELIGFDLYTIEYEAVAIEDGDTTEVQFQPVDLPETGLEIDLGGSVFVSVDGAIQEARLYWLSLVDTREVALRDPEDMLSDIENGHGYTPPMNGDDEDDMMLDVEEMKVVHVLTRVGDANFLLQPAVKFMGQYGSGVESEIPGPARYLIPAVNSGD